MADGRLGEIVAAKRVEVRERLSGIAAGDLRARARPTRRSLAMAMARPGGRFIFEFKRSSPSEGGIRPDADPVAIAAAYAGVADAISVLTDRRFFGGSLADLSVIRARFDGPILAKDFVVDPRQVAEARIAGADAVLAILAVLDDREARVVIEEARLLGMDVLVEVHDEAEMRRALALEAPLIGINNRDLRRFRTDLAVTERLAPMAKGRTLIAESGIASRGDVNRLAPHVDGFLIGSSVMRAEDPGDAARALAFGRVKLCGLRTAGDLETSALACYAGLVFVPGTPRAISFLDAEAAVSGAASHPPLVGVFRDAPLEAVIEAARRLPLTAVQLHGRENADYIRALRHVTDLEIWTAQSASNGARPDGDRVLFDSGAGGSGETFDWRQIKSRPELARGLLAGGIGAHNARAAQEVGAHAIDVGSAVDLEPGVKSRDKIAALFQALRPSNRAEVALQCA